jgi:alpha-D-xyloside xylohydrolase
MSANIVLRVRIHQFAVFSSVILLWAIASVRLAAQIPGVAIPSQPITTVIQTNDGMTATVGSETLHVAVCSESVVHVTASPKPLSEQNEPVHSEPWMLDHHQACPGAPFQYRQSSDASTLITRTLTVTFSVARGNLTYATAHGDVLLREGNAVPRTYEPPK